MRLAVRMSNDFAIDLYRRLAHEYVHDNSSSSLPILLSTL